MKKFKINKPKNGQKYLKRTGAYAIIKENEKLALIKTRTGYFLPGGGLNEGETKKECLARECREEAGLEIEILEKLGRGDYCFYSTTKKTDMISIGYFYKVKIKKVLDIPSESDHKLIWVKPQKAIECLFLKNQKEAVRVFSK